MNLPKMLALPLVALFALACADHCKDSCDDLKKCPGANANADCESFCDKGEVLSEHANCQDKWDDLADCYSDQNGACQDKDSACDGQLAAVGACFTTYCRNTAHSSECSAFASASPKPLF